MAKIMYGADVAESMIDEIKTSLSYIKDKTLILVIVRTGYNPEVASYEQRIIKSFKNLGIAVEIYPMAYDISQEEFNTRFCEINSDPDVDAILLTRPLLMHLDDSGIRKIIDPRKDVDGMGIVNQVKLFAGEKDGLFPCTAEAIMRMLRHYYSIRLIGKNVVVVGRSNTVGKPLAALLTAADATVTLCHSRTIGLVEICRRADVIVSCAGKLNLITPEFVTEKSIVIDVGINVGPDGKIHGDVDFENVSPIVSMISPVPGGVGKITTLMLAENMLKARMLV